MNLVFTPTEIDDLNKIIQFFTLEMCGNNSSFEDCINSSIKELGDYGFQPILRKINFEKQKKLYDEFDSNIFQEIWSFCKVLKPEGEPNFKSLCYNTNGKYNKFLKEVAKANQIVKAYQNDLEAAGDFSGIMRIEGEIYRNTGRIDISDPNIQLILAIEYLSQNDQEKRSEVWSED